MSLAIYVVGFIIFIVGLSIGAHLLHVPPHWIAVMDVVLAGLGIMSGVRGTRQRDPS